MKTIVNCEKIIQPKEFSVKNIFNDMEYVVPIYQRNYAWTKDEIEQLLNDINDIPDGFKRKYYLGSLIVNQMDKDIFEVIDGQQRLTTLYLLLSYLDDKSINKNSLRFEAREKSNKTLYDIFSIKGAYSELEKEFWYSTEIVEGYSVIRRYFEREDENFVEKFKNKLPYIKIIRTQVPKDIDLNHYFEIMNTRGEQLELHEVVKAKIISAIKTGDTITESDKKDKKIAAVIWDACAQMDKYVQMCFPLDKRKKIFGEKNWDTFMCNSFDDIRMAFGDDKYDEENRISLLSILKNHEGINKKVKVNKEDESERFESIITFPNFILQVNEAMSISENDDDASLDDKRFIELLKDKWSSKDKALEFIYSLLRYRYIFDKYIIKREYIGQHKVEGKWSLQRLEMYKDIRGAQNPLYKATIESNDCDENEDFDMDNENKHLRMLQSCLRITYTSPKTMHWIARVMAYINKDNNAKSIIQLLEKYCCDKVVESNYETRKGTIMERIVFTYLDYILWRDNKIEFKNFQFQFRTSIEHFFPQHPINSEDMVSKRNLNSLGNLALITASANSKFSNMLPIHKVEQYKDIVEQSPKLMRMSKLLNNNRIWNDDTIEIHNLQMLNLLKVEIEKYDK